MKEHRCFNCGLHNLQPLPNTTKMRCPGCGHQYIIGNTRYETAKGEPLDYLGEDENGHRQFQKADGTILTAVEEEIN